MAIANRDAIPERKEVTARIERMKKEQAERDRQLRESREAEQPQEVAQGR
jgi:uncharacterized protein YaiL (DUF2058 family)